MNNNIHKFDGKAKDYADARPTYPESAVDYVVSLVFSKAGFLSSDVVVADIGAGTGKFSQCIARRGMRLCAIEPNMDMLSQLSLTLREYSSARIVDAPAENTTLRESSIDVITVAQALCWFDLEAFKIECKRIARPNGIVVAIYNQMPASATAQQSHKSMTNDQAVKLFFNNPTTKQFSQTLNYTKDRWQRYVDSISYQPQDLKTYFDTNNVDGILSVDVVTTVHSQLVSEL